MHDGASQPTGPAQIVVMTLRAVERDLGGPLDDGRVARIEEIFFVSSNTRHFATDQERHAFRHRWLGRYLEHYRDHVFVALAPGHHIVGYLAGCLEDPAQQPLFADIGYLADLSDLTRQYPAHLHINLDPEWRNRGIGARLVEAFCSHARVAGAPGVHVVTGSPARNVGFYRRCGFHELRKVAWHGELMCLGRQFAPAP